MILVNCSLQEEGEFPAFLRMAKTSGRNSLNGRNLGNDVLTNCQRLEYNEIVWVAVRFFSGVPHPHLLGVCCPDIEGVIYYK